MAVAVWKAAKKPAITWGRLPAYRVEVEVEIEHPAPSGDRLEIVWRSSGVLYRARRHGTLVISPRVDAVYVSPPRVLCSVQGGDNQRTAGRRALKKPAREADTHQVCSVLASTLTESAPAW